MQLPFPHFGEMLAFTTAVVWSFSVILFKKSGETVHPIALNLFKNALAAVLLMPTIWFMGSELLRPAPLSDYGLLLVSGALGIGISDTLFFMSLNILGAGLSAIVDCMYSPSIIGLSILWLDESLSAWQILGVALILSAVLMATVGKSDHGLTRGRLLLGVALGISSMVVMAVGIVMVKPLLERSPLAWVSEWRLIGGILMLGLILLFHPLRKGILTSLHTPKGWGYMVGGSFLGAYVALLLWLGGMKYAHASIAAALNQTSNIMVFVLAALLLRERLNLQRIAGIILGVAGAYLVTFA